MSICHILCINNLYNIGYTKVYILIINLSNYIIYCQISHKYYVYQISMLFSICIYHLNLTFIYITFDIHIYSYYNMFYIYIYNLYILNNKIYLIYILSTISIIN